MPVRSRRCTDCRCEYDVLEHGGQVLTVDLPDGDERDVCPACEGPSFVELAKAPLHVDSDSRFYNRYDAGLGCYVQDRAHHKRIMAERGLERGDWGGFEREHSRRKSLDEKREKAMREDHDRRLATDVDYRKVVAEGVPADKPEPIAVRVNTAATAASTESSP